MIEIPDRCLTVGQVIEKLKGLPQELPMTLFANFNCYPVLDVEMFAGGEYDMKTDFVEIAGGENALKEDR